MRGAAVLFLLVMDMFARDNPFDERVKQRDFGVSVGNHSEAFLDTISLKLPSSARSIRSITLEYINVDGSVSEKKVSVDKSIDWHYPLQISQREAIRNIAHRYFTLGDFEFFIDGSRLIVKSKHNMVRHFLLAGPSIVIDYDRGKGAPYMGSMGTGEKHYASIKLESGEKFYRISIALDGTYDYHMANKDGMQIIGVK